MTKQRQYLTTVNVGVLAILLMIGGVVVSFLVSSPNMVLIAAAVATVGCGLLLYAIKLSKKSG